MDHSERYNCSTRLELFDLREREEECSSDRIWITIKVKIKDLKFEDEGQLKLDLSILKQMLQDHSWRVPVFNTLQAECPMPADIQSSVAHDILIQLSFLLVAPEIVNADDKVLHMAVSIAITHYNEPEIGAVSILLMASLEKVKVKVSTMCSICSEEIVVGSEATSMRCWHLYHGDCIVDWLQKNRFCPLCHFPKTSHILVGEK